MKLWATVPTALTSGPYFISARQLAVPMQPPMFRTLADNDAYHALQAADGLIITGATGTNVNDVAVVLIGNQG